MSDPTKQSRTPTTETSPDLSSVIRNNISEGNLSLEVKEREDPADRAARLEILKADAQFTRIKDAVLLLAGVLLNGSDTFLRSDSRKLLILQEGLN